MLDPGDDPMRPVLVVLVALVAGCSGGSDATPDSRATPAPVSREASGDCFRAWNAAGNARNRAAAAGNHDGWSVAVSEWMVSHPAAAPSGNDLVGTGCSYFFHSSTRWQSYSGGWEADGGLRWQTPPAAGGRRTPEQQLQPPNAVLGPQGRLVRLSPDGGRPVSDREWRAVIDDWYDNGELDRAHRCRAVRAAIEQVPVEGRDITTAREDLLAYAARVCAP